MKTLLVITDGIGYHPDERWNAFAKANKPTYQKLFATLPYGMIRTYGLDVGLPEGQMGNSEVGHLCLGSGRILYQDLVKINQSIKDGTLLQKPALQTLKPCKRIHLIGLMSDGGVHSHYSHLLALAHGLQKDHQILLHLITDGRDVLQQSALTYLASIEDSIKHTSICIASLIGRFFAMDRDNRWDRTKEAYDTITQAKNPQSCTPKDYILSQYKQQIFDEFLTPASFGGFSGIQQGDGLLFVNYRSDRMRQITQAFGDPTLSTFERECFLPLPLISMTQYNKSFPHPILFPKDPITNTLAQVISKHNLRQFHTAETEKYAHVTFFFNGGIEEPYPNETRVLIPSPKVKTYDTTPQMSAKEVCQATLRAMDEKYDFIVVNFANGDMLGHTGVLDAATKAVEVVDECLGQIWQKAKESDYALIITSDHGNCEQMQNEKGEILTNHTAGDVWCFVDAPHVSKVQDGRLSNIAPSILKLLGLSIPKEMESPLF